ncbi:MAG TPA: NADH-quinone oxidoreductase subunit M [Polyangiaceae bacterium]|nr:NADH-quinone oxidoreductase subunit M [Polyangiaceae bacterium]
MSPLAAALIDLWPYIAAFAVGLLIPKRGTTLERVAVGIIGVLSVAAVSGLWPGKQAVSTETVPEEWPHLLSVIVFLPILGAVALLFLPRQTPGLLRRFTLAVMAADFIASLALLSVPMTKGWHFQQSTEWLPAFGIRYHVAVDGVSLWLVLLSTLTSPIAMYASFGSIKKRTKDLCFSFLLLQGAMLGAFVSLDLFLFYVFWELMLIPMILIIGIWGGVEKIKAAYKFFLYTMFGSVLMLASILYLVWTHKQIAGYVTFDYLALRRLVLPETAAWLCYAAFALAFVIKVPMFPFHTWLPDAHVQAPTGGSVILAAVLLKLGTYGYIRFCMGMFEGPAWAASATLATVAVVFGIIYGALVAWKQPDVKKLVAYSSVAHLGFVMLGIFGATQAGVQGAILQMVNHGVSTGALFLLIGVIYDRRHTRLMNEFGGLAKVMPVYAVLFIIVTMASVGVPGTNGFVGEFMIIMGTIVSQVLERQSMSQAAVAAFGVILAAVYMLHVVQKMFFGPVDNPKNEHLDDVTPRETLALAPLVALVFVIGFFPNVFLSRMQESVAGVLDSFVDGQLQYSQHQGDPAAVLRPRRGGPLEQGYPEPPGEKTGTVATNEVAK